MSGPDWRGSDAWEAAELGVDVIWPEFNNTELDQPQEFAEGCGKYYPNQMLGFSLSPSLYFGKANKAGKLITNQRLADLGIEFWQSRPGECRHETCGSGCRFGGTWDFRGVAGGR